MVYPPQGAGAVTVTVTPIKMLKHDRQVQFSDTDSSTPKISIEGNLYPLQIYVVISNLDLDVTASYTIKAVWSDGSESVLDSGSIPPLGEVVYNKIVHDIDDYAMGNPSLFDKLKDNLYIRKVEVYSWFTSPPSYFGLARLVMVGFKW